MHPQKGRRWRRRQLTAGGPVPGIERLEARTLLAAAPPVLVKDPSSAHSLVEVDGKTFFVDSPTSSLYVTNGTGGGTFLLRTFEKITNLTNVEGTLYFSTHDGVWRSDGTVAGTVHVLPMHENVDGIARASGYTAVGGTVYFYADVRTVASGLWKTDGTFAGTSLVKGVPAESLFAVGQTLYFVGQDERGKELWKSDGTEAGTHLVKDIIPGSAGSMFAVAGNDPMAAVGDKLLFMANGGSGNYSLWISDGTAAGTVPLTTTDQVRLYGNLTELGDVVYFSAFDASSNQEIWRSDGTPDGTYLVKELGPNHATGFANRAWQLTNVNGTLFFAASNGFESANLWKSDGTETGTVVVAGTATGAPFASLSSLTNAGGTLVFRATAPADGSGPHSLWTSDGTTAGTVKVRDTFQPNVQGRPGDVGALGSLVLFTANDGVGAPELYAYETAAVLPLPRAVARGPVEYVVQEGHSLRLHGYATANPLPGRPLTYRWDLDGDGAFGETGSAAARGDENGTNPTFNASGLDGPSTHVVRLRISDPTGYSDTAQAEVRVLDAPPTFDVTGGPATLVEGNLYTLNLSASDAGPDDAIMQWIVDWGDGVVETFPGDVESVTHLYPSGYGAYGILVKAVDADGTYRVDRPAARDATFGAAGVVTSNVSDREDSPRDLLVQADGKIVTVSTIQLSALSGNTTIAINRYNRDGTLDDTFGDGGRVQFREFFGTWATAVALQTDGRILVSGAIGRSGADSLLLRLLPDGSIDRSFGQQGSVRLSLGSISDHFTEVAVAPDGSIVAAGSAQQKVLLARFTSAGALVEGFGNGGYVTLDIGANVNDMVLQPDGKILLVPNIADGFVVARYEPDGSPDPTFGSNGRVTVDFEHGPGSANSLALAPDGRILVAGSAPRSPFDPQPGGNDAVVARLTPSGTLDLTFGQGGRLRTAPAGPYNSSVPLKGMSLPMLGLLPDGRFYLAGSYDPSLNRWQYLVDRYHADGTPDQSFGPGGRFLLDLGIVGNSRLLQRFKLQPDGAPLLFISGWGTHDEAEVLVRLEPPGLSVQVVDAAVPELSLSAPASTAEGSTYVLGLSANDPDGDGITGWIINWGDGTIDLIDGNPSSATHVYADGPNTYQIKTSVFDGAGSMTTVRRTVTVNNVPPTLTVDAPPQATEGSSYTIQFSASDPGLDTISKWVVDWGDGTIRNFTGNATSAQHVYQASGPRVITVTATDEDGSYSAQSSVLVNNVPPTIDPPGPRVAAAGADFRFAFRMRDVVPENFSGTIDWGDGGQVTLFEGSPTAPAIFRDFAITHTYGARGNYVITVTASDGDDEVTATTTVAVGDVAVRAFNDANGNGTWDLGEAPRQGETVFVDLNGNGNIDSGEPVRTTDAFGDALFDALPPAGSYLVRLRVPLGWHLTSPAAGYAQATPGGPSAVASFGLSQAAAVTGALFDDANVNGVRDPGEAGIVHTVRARKLDNNAITNGTVSSTGEYVITGLLPGTYLVEALLPWSPARLQTMPAAVRGYLLTLDGERSLIGGLDFGSAVATGGAFGGTVFRDLDGNGLRDAGEPGVAGVAVYLDANRNGVRDLDEISVTSNSQGGWSLPRVAPGTYFLRQVLPPGFDDDHPGSFAEATVGLSQVTTVNLARPFEVTYYVRRLGNHTYVYLGSEATQTPIQSVSSTSTSPFVLSTSSGDDWVIVDWAHGNPIPAGGMHVSGLGGTRDTLSIIGTSGGDTVIFGEGSVTLSGMTVTFDGFERATFDGMGGWDSLHVEAGPAVTLAPAQALQSLVLAAGVTARLASGGGMPLLTRGELTLADGARLDLLNGVMVIDHAGESPIGSWNGSSYTGVTGLLASGHHGGAAGAWSGHGIVTSSPEAQTGLKTLAIATAAEVLGLTGDATARWHGVSVSAASVLIRYTYAGDANLDGVINIDDYGQIDFNVGLGGAVLGYFNGDFNYDGLINIDDYGIIDFNVGIQGPPLAANLAAETSFMMDRKNSGAGILPTPLRARDSWNRDANEAIASDDEELDELLVRAS